jgi:hypothetical protein
MVPESQPAAGAHKIRATNFVRNHLNRLRDFYLIVYWGPQELDMSLFELAPPPQSPKEPRKPSSTRRLRGQLVAVQSHGGFAASMACLFGHEVMLALEVTIATMGICAATFLLFFAMEAVDRRWNT